MRSDVRNVCNQWSAFTVLFSIFSKGMVRIIFLRFRRCCVVVVKAEGVHGAREAHSDHIKSLTLSRSYIMLRSCKLLRIYIMLRSYKLLRSYGLIGPLVSQCDRQGVACVWRESFSTTRERLTLVIVIICQSWVILKHVTHFFKYIPIERDLKKNAWGVLNIYIYYTLQPFFTLLGDLLVFFQSTGFEVDVFNSWQQIRVIQ